MHACTPTHRSDDQHDQRAVIHVTTQLILLPTTQLILLPRVHTHTGATINAIKEQSGARVKVSSNQETFPGTNDRIILIQGGMVSFFLLEKEKSTPCRPERE